MAANSDTSIRTLRRYYSVHARIYDATRWSFLFGRRRLMREVGQRLSPARIVEIGCGTGVNLDRLARMFPRACLTGIDTSAAMLGAAKRRLGFLGNRVKLLERHYDGSGELGPAPDLICLSYCLSMINPGVEDAIGAVAADLAPGGSVAVVDFHGTRRRWFRHWMQVNHVRMEQHLLPLLGARFHAELTGIETAYAGLWQFFFFLGRLPAPDLVRPAAPRANPPLLGSSAGILAARGPSPH